jgi:glycosyltransferase involved in cell wall biosynthesis
MMPKINLLFVMPDLSAGGGEKSLVNLLSHINYEMYQVDLILFNKSGVFIDSLPKEVIVLDMPENHQIFSDGLKNSLGRFMLKGRMNLAYARFMFTLKNRIFKHHATSEQNTWKYYSRSLEVLDKEYDAAIGYMEKSSIYFVVEKVKAKKKIGWIHTNYSTSGMDDDFDTPYFSRLDHLVTVSEECAKSLVSHFSHLQSKVKVIYNIISPHIINQLSENGIPNEMISDAKHTKIVTIARLSNEKGIDIAIKSCKLLVSRGYSIQWYILGEGSERERLEDLIQGYDLETNFHLLGIKENPYPYIKASDIYVQPSRYEGKSLAIDEAKILQKPIVVTNFETAKDQLQHGVDGIIVELSEEALCNGIEMLIRDQAMKDRLVNNLGTQKLGTEGEIRKLYDIVN